MPAPQTEQIEIVVNGEIQTVPQGLNLTGLLDFLKVDPQRVAVELNRSIVARRDWTTAPIDSGSTLEIVQFVGGG